jgi:LPXTG-site transpeptidase (sortase) family protein
MDLKQLFDELYTQIKNEKIAFLAVFFVCVLITYAVLFAIDFIPEPKAEATTVTTGEEIGEVSEEAEAVVVPEEKELSPLPLKIIIDRLDKKIAVHNPESRDVAILDAALLKGVVRHPDSADLVSEGNIFILGHSSYLPNVLNKNFQAFNGIQDLVWGDTIKLQSADAEYVYRVQKVYKAKAADVVVPFTPGKAMLTLATCNSFGSKDDRFVVEAALIETKEL